MDPATVIKNKDIETSGVNRNDEEAESLQQ